MFQMDALIPTSLLLLVLPLAPRMRQPVTIPTRFIENMFYARPVTDTGVVLTFYTDSGGGEFIFRSVVDALHLPLIHEQIDGKGMDEALPPPFKESASIPLPLEREGRLFVMADSERPPVFDPDMSGLLGQEWFADRVWTWDYPGHHLLWRADGDMPSVPAAHRISVGFMSDESGRRHRSQSFARIQANVDGEMLDLLFDTGANTVLTAKALNAIHDGHGIHRATSFISQSIFDRWHARHPDWTVIENAEEHTGASMIKVQSLEVAGYTVGPVWFTSRPDRNFTEWMSQWMDRKVYGALGGSALQYFRLTVDYPDAKAYFERP